MIQNSGGVYEKVFELLEKDRNERNILGLPKLKTLCDVGGGTGEFAWDAMKKGFSVTTCGYEGLKFKKIPFKKVDLNKDDIPYDNDSFEIVTAIELFEHLEDGHHLIRELYRICKPGGIVIISTPNISTWYYRLYFLLTGKLIGFDKNSGYSLDHIRPYNQEIFDPFVQIYFNIKEITYNRAFIPLLRINIPFLHNLTGDSRIIVLKKK